MSASATSTPRCIIDRTILNEDTLGDMDDVGLTVFASLCGANRGAFVLQPPDGNTYGCTTFPESFSRNAGLNYTIPNSANLTQSYAAGDISASATIEVVDQYVSAVYASSFPGVDSNPYGCNVNGLATLVDCPTNSGTKKSIRPDGDIIRAVTLAGAFISQPWITGGKSTLSMEEVKEFYKLEDFVEMATLGVNTIQIPVPCDTFFVNGEVAKTVSHLLVKAANAGLSAIIVLVVANPDESVLVEHVKSAAIFASASSNVVALQIPPTSSSSSSASLVDAVRSKAAKLPVLVPTDKGQLNNLSFPSDRLVFAALDVDAKSSIADIASADSVSDRLKMFYHESLVCIDRAPIEWLDCYHDIPIYVTSGFDLGIDDCIHQDEDAFNNYGQCDRFNETIDSAWWDRHRQSLASRQLFTYSKGLGWSFSAWKLFGEDDDSGSIETPSKLLCLRDVAAAGLMPSLTTTSTDDVDLDMACLNGPKSDFIMGDATFAPTAAPHDCGNGWWNDTTLQCDYWIPPPPAPPAPIDYTTLMKGAAGGAIVAFVLVWLAKKITGGRYENYQTLP